jgi:hypothetical protein
MHACIFTCTTTPLKQGGQKQEGMKQGGHNTSRCVFVFAVRVCTAAVYSAGAAAISASLAGVSVTTGKLIGKSASSTVIAAVYLQCCAAIKWVGL